MVFRGSSFLVRICIDYVTMLWFRQTITSFSIFWEYSLDIQYFPMQFFCDLHSLSDFRIISLIMILERIAKQKKKSRFIDCVAAPVALFLLHKGMVRINISRFGNGWKRKWWREKVLPLPSITNWLLLMINTTKLQVVVSLGILI